MLAPTLKTIRHTKERKEVHKVIAFCMAQRTHNCNVLQRQWASLMAQLVKNRPATWETWVRSLGWEDPLEKEQLPTSIFWPGEFHGLYSPWGLKELDMTEQLSLHFTLAVQWLGLHASTEGVGVQSLITGKIPPHMPHSGAKNNK